LSCLKHLVYTVYHRPQPDALHKTFKPKGEEAVKIWQPCISPPKERKVGDKNKEEEEEEEEEDAIRKVIRIKNASKNFCCCWLTIDDE
jgi:hypothetical protein